MLIGGPIVSNAFLSVLQQTITVILALMGVIVARRPPKKGTWQEYVLISAFLVLGLCGVGLTYVQGHRLDVASAKRGQQLDAIQKNTGKSAPRAIIEATPATKPFHRSDGRVQINTWLANNGNQDVNVNWSGKLWVFWDAEVPKEPKAQGEFEDKLWKQLEAGADTNVISGSVNIGVPKQIRSTIGDDVFNEDEFRAIEQSTRIVYLMATARYEDGHETPLCVFYWSKDNGNYEACRGHNVPH